MTKPNECRLAPPRSPTSPKRKHLPNSEVASATLPAVTVSVLCGMAWGLGCPTAHREASVHQPGGLGSTPRTARHSDILSPGWQLGTFVTCCQTAM